MYRDDVGLIAPQLVVLMHDEHPALISPAGIRGDTANSPSRVSDISLCASLKITRATPTSAELALFFPLGLRSLMLSGENVCFMCDEQLIFVNASFIEKTDAHLSTSH